MVEEKMFRIDSSIELDYIKKGICSFCKQKVDISEFENKLFKSKSIDKEISVLRFIKRIKLKHFKKNKRCKLAR